jgi:hypothetical protein
MNLVADRDDYMAAETMITLNGRDSPKVVSLPLASGGHHLAIPPDALPGGSRVVVALPEIPPDHRKLLDPILVEIHSGSSGHEWLGKHYLGMGYRVGFIAGSTSHLPVRNLLQGQTAIVVANDKIIGESIQARSTYATSGPRSILLVDVNGGLPGSRVPLRTLRKIQGSIYSNSAIDSVELIRNGIVIDRYRPAVVDESLQIKVTLGSESRPVVSAWDLPRNGREWLGYIRVAGAEIESISAPGYKDRKRSAISFDPANSARVDFITWTHGSESSFVITLKEPFAQNVSLELNIKEGYEDVDYMPVYRQPSETSAFSQSVTLSAIVDGAVERSVDTNGYDDFIRFELTNTPKVGKVSFSFVDTRKLGINDSYYIKVKQSDDHTLWSSPVYVGGFDNE